jgi:hypothetical protein
VKRHVVDGGWYADALPTGAWAASRHADDLLVTDKGVLTPPERLLFVRLADDGRIAGQGHTSNKAVEYKAGAWKVLPYTACGVSPVIYDANGHLLISDCGPGIGSQGYRYVTATGVVVGDQSYGPKHGVDLFEWTDLGNGYRVGQGPDDNGAWFYDGAKYYEVITGKARFIRARLAGDLVSIACWLEPHQSSFLWATVDEIRANFTAKDSPRLEKPAPVPDSEIPNVPPEPTPEPMPIDTARLHAALQAERSKYPDTLTDDEQAATIMNDALWTVRDEGWGLSAKPDGNRVWSREHDRYVSYDAVHHKPTDTIHDAATDEWPAMRIVAPHQVAHHGRADRPWLAPVQPFINNEQPPKPEQPLPEPPPLPTPGNTCQCAEVLAQIKAIHDDVSQHRLDMADMEVAIRNTILALVFTGQVKGGWPLGTVNVTLTPQEQEQ